MTKFTKEQLSAKAREQIAFCRNTKITGEGRAHVNQCSALFEIALAAMTAEPVYQLINYDWYDTTKDVYESVVSAGGRGRIVYTAPPAPVVPDEWKLQDAIDFIEKYTPASEEEAALFAWNACHAAMLAAAPQRE